MLSKKLAEVNIDRCVSCSTCKKVCPRNVISIYKGCYAVVNEELCVGCGRCISTCPAGCITLKERA